MVWTAGYKTTAISRTDVATAEPRRECDRAEINLRQGCDRAATGPLQSRYRAATWPRQCFDSSVRPRQRCDSAVTVLTAVCQNSYTYLCTSRSDTGAYFSADSLAQ